MNSRTGYGGCSAELNDHRMVIYSKGRHICNVNLNVQILKP